MSEELNLNEEQINELKNAFLKADNSADYFLEMKELRSALKLVGFDLPGYEVRMMEDDFNKMDLNKDGKLSFEEFQNLYIKLKTQSQTRSCFKNLIKPIGNDVKLLKKVEGNSESMQSIHFVKNSEKEAFCKWINQNLKDDDDLNLASNPLSSDGSELFERCADGILLCKLINFCVTNTIDERSINKGKKISIYQQLENLELALRSAEGIGCHIVNVRPKDISDGKEHLILGLLWQTIQIGLFSEINLNSHPELMCLLNDEEEQDDLMRLNKEEILIRWVNYHLSNSNFVGEPIKNFGEDIKDSRVYTYLLNQIAPDDIYPELSLDPLKSKDLFKRAELVLQEAEKLNVREFITADEIVQGHSKLNMAFIANLFNKYPALNEINDSVLVIEETREEKTFRNWMNSMGVKPKINYLYCDLQDGLAIFQLYDVIKQASVNWDKVVQVFSSNRKKFQKLDNCNYVIEIGKKQMNFKLIGIQGSNLLDGHKNFTLALVWQLMRAYIISLLQKLTNNGTPIGDKEIIEWANAKLISGNKESSIQSFQDQSISDSKIICDLIDSIRPSSVKYEILLSEDDHESKMANARYAVSIARKLGARVFALPEDIAEVKPKMVMTVFATLMILDFQSN